MFKSKCLVIVLIALATLSFASTELIARNSLEIALRKVEKNLCKVIKSKTCIPKKPKTHDQKMTRPLSKPAKSRTSIPVNSILPLPQDKPSTAEPIPPKPTIAIAPEPIPPKPTIAIAPEPIPPEPTIATAPEPIPPEPIIAIAPEPIPPEPTMAIVPPTPLKPKPEPAKPAILPPILLPLPVLPSDAAPCQAALTKLNVTFSSTPAYEQQGSCVIENPVQIRSFGLNGQTLEFPDQPILNCSFALQFIRFIHESAAPALVAQTFSHITKLYTGPGFVCRGRNGDSSAKLSEHALGNAVDIERIQLSDGRIILVKDAISALTKDYPVLTAIRHSACTYFTTVLGPGANEAHASHFHFDMEKRGKSGTYRICE